MKHKLTRYSQLAVTVSIPLVLADSCSEPPEFRVRGRANVADPQPGMVIVWTMLTLLILAYVVFTANRRNMMRETRTAK